MTSGRPPWHRVAYETPMGVMVHAIMSKFVSNKSLLWSGPSDAISN